MPIVYNQRYESRLAPAVVFPLRQPWRQVLRNVCSRLQKMSTLIVMVQVMMFTAGCSMHRFPRQMLVNGAAYDQTPTCKYDTDHQWCKSTLHSAR
jgi:hypothetical protein